MCEPMNPAPPVTRTLTVRPPVRSRPLGRWSKRGRRRRRSLLRRRRQPPRAASDHVSTSMRRSSGSGSQRQLAKSSSSGAHRWSAVLIGTPSKARAWGFWSPSAHQPPSSAGPITQSRASRRPMAWSSMRRRHLRGVHADLQGRAGPGGPRELEPVGEGGSALSDDPPARREPRPGGAVESEDPLVRTRPAGRRERVVQGGLGDLGRLLTVQWWAQPCLDPASDR